MYYFITAIAVGAISFYYGLASVFEALMKSLIY